MNILFKDISKVIIMSDMDGTLLNSDKKISEKEINPKEEKIIAYLTSLVV